MHERERYRVFQGLSIRYHKGWCQQASYAWENGSVSSRCPGVQASRRPGVQASRRPDVQRQSSNEWRFPSGPKPQGNHAQTANCAPPSSNRPCLRLDMRGRKSGEGRRLRSVDPTPKSSEVSEVFKAKASRRRSSSIYQQWNLLPWTGPPR